MDFCVDNFFVIAFGMYVTTYLLGIVLEDLIQMRKMVVIEDLVAVVMKMMTFGRTQNDIDSLVGMVANVGELVRSTVARKQTRGDCSIKITELVILILQEITRVLKGMLKRVEAGRAQEVFIAKQTS